MSVLLSLLTAKVLPLVIPPLVAAIRAWVLKNVNPRWVPVLLTGGAAVVDVAATALGVEGTPDLAMLGAAAWEGALVGLAGVGIHQVYSKAKK